MDLSNQIIKNIDKSMDLIDTIRKSDKSDDLSLEENEFLAYFFQSLFHLRFEIQCYSNSSERKFELIKLDLKSVSLINQFNIDIKNAILTSNVTRYAELNKILAELSSQFSINSSRFDKESDDFSINLIIFFVKYSNHYYDEIDDNEKQMVDTDVSYMFELIEHNQEAIELLKKCIRDRPRFKPILDDMSKQVKCLKLTDDTEMSIMNVIVQSKVIKNFDFESMLLALQNLSVDISNKDVIDFIKSALFQLKKFEIEYKLHFNGYKIKIFELLVGLDDKKRSTPEKLEELKSQIVKHRINNKKMINDHANILTKTRDMRITFDSVLLNELSSTVDNMTGKIDSLFISDDLTDLYLQIQERYHHEKKNTIKLD